MSKTQLHVDLSDELMKSIRDAARQEERPVSQWVRRTLAARIEQLEDYRRRGVRDAE